MSYLPYKKSHWVQQVCTRAVFALVICLSIGFAWPELGQKNNGETDSPSVKKDTAALEPTISGEAIPVKKEDGDSPKDKVTVAAAPVIPHVPRIPGLADEGSLEIERQIRDIVRLNESLQLKQSQQVLQIQRIQEQARAHEQIFRNLAIMKNSVPASVSVPRVPVEPGLFRNRQFRSQGIDFPTNSGSESDQQASPPE